MLLVLLLQLRDLLHSCESMAKKESKVSLSKKESKDPLPKKQLKDDFPKKETLASSDEEIDVEAEQSKVLAKLQKLKSKKESSSKKESAAAAADMSSSKTATVADIDDIFGQLPKKKAELKAKREQEEQEEKRKELRKRKSTSVLDDLPKTHRFTDDGLPIYTEEELNVGKGGGKDPTTPKFAV